MKFSLITPSRSRPNEYKQLIESVLSTTENINNVEMLVIIDKDDSNLKEYQDMIKLVKDISCKLYAVDRKNHISKYYNELAFKSKGKYIWAINDDCLIKTPSWDILAWMKLESEYIASNGILYGETNDSTRNYNGNGFFSCFPILSRKAIDRMGYFFNDKYITWGGDKFLKYLYSDAGAGIVDLLNVFVDHKHIMDDDTYKELIGKLGDNANIQPQFNYDDEVNKLREAICC